MLPFEGQEPTETAIAAGDEPVADEAYVTSDTEEEAAWQEAELGRGFDLASAAPYLAALLVAGWTAFYIYAHFDEMARTDIVTNGALWTSWIANWAMPVMLIIGLWLLAMRTSRRSTRRFVDAAQLLSDESRALEVRLAVVNRELSMARDFIASQSRDLESLGRVAAERILNHAEKLQGLVLENSERVRLIGSVSETAVANLEKLRGDMPVLANAARDMTNQIGNAGNVAQDRLEKLVEGFARLDEYGEAGERHVEQISNRITETLDTFDRQASELGDGAHQRLNALLEEHEANRMRLGELDAASANMLMRRAEELASHLKDRDEAINSAENARTEAMRRRMQIIASEHEDLFGKLDETRGTIMSTWEETVGQLEARLTEAIGKVTEIDSKAMTNAQSRLLALNEEAKRVDATLAQSALAFDADLERRRSEAEAREADALAAMEERLALVDQRITEREEQHLAHVAGLAERGEALAERIAQLDLDIQGLGSQASEAGEALGDRAALVAERLAQSRAVLEENSAMVSRLTDDSVRLLELIRSGAEHADGTLAASLGRAEKRLSDFQRTGQNVQQLITEAEGRGSQLAEHLAQARETGGASLEILQSLQGQLDEVTARSQALAAETRGELQEAIDLLTATSASVLQDVRSNQAETIREIAESIAEESNAAIASALTQKTRGVISDLQESTRKAAESGRHTTIELRDQLGRVNELIGNLEQRISAARDKAEERKDGDFTRRMALITESLNSNAIDIAKTFDTDVGDDQWANYLRGDRGIFTRRAVRLLDKQEARQVHEAYTGDADLRHAVNRYIADFEGMLRTVLSTRDGNAMAITLLSSDIGKLYVALAQAIERLRE